MSKTTTTTEEFDAEGNLLKRTVEVWEDGPTEEPAKPFIKDLGSDLPETRPKAKGGLIYDDYLELTEGHWIPRPDKYPYAPCNIHAMRVAQAANVASGFDLPAFKKMLGLPFYWEELTRP